MRTVLIVCNTYWNVYDAGDFTCLLSVPCQRGERWLGGEFISGDKLCCWSDSGRWGHVWVPLRANDARRAELTEIVSKFNQEKLMDPGQSCNEDSKSKIINL